MNKESKRLESLEKNTITNEDKNIFLGVVLAGFLFNILYGVIQNEFGHDGNSLFFIFKGDPFADFFKSSLSYVSYDAERFKQFPNVYTYLIDNPYKGAQALNDVNILTNFHNPPGTVLIKLLQADLIKKYGPVPAFELVAVLSICVLLKSLKMAGGYKSYFYVFFLLMFSYPVLFALFRGNTQAIINASALIGFMAFANDERHSIVRSVLLAISINLRPVSVVFILYYFLKGNYKEFLRNALIVFGFTIIILYISLVYDSARYDGYDIKTFLEGVRHYKWIYIISPRYLQEEFNTSIYAIIRNNEVYNLGIDSVKLLVFGLIGMVLIVVKGQMVYDKAMYSGLELFYLLFFVYIVLFPLTIVYHLIPLLGMISLALRNKKTLGAFKTAFIVVPSFIVITSKDFLGKGYYEPVLFDHKYDLQLLLNVSAILLSVISILVYRVKKTVKMLLLEMIMAK